jgi:beta-glucosidase/6-phospho-beta-glucosidase/beta-galactosidase
MLTSYYAIPFATNFPPAVVRTDLVAVGLLNQAAAYSASYDLIHRFDAQAQVGFALNMYSWRAGDPTNPGDQQTAADFSDFYNRVDIRNMTPAQQDEYNQAQTRLWRPLDAMPIGPWPR